MSLEALQAVRGGMGNMAESGPSLAQQEWRRKLEERDTVTRLYQLTATDPLVNHRALLTKLVEAHGFDPAEIIISRT